MECESCRTSKEDVKYVIDPYDQDVNNEVRWCWLCDSCYQNHCDDI
jgi:hypothetical protein